MKHDDKQADAGRRAFLRGSVAGGAGAAIAATVPGVALTSAGDGQDDAGRPEKGYHLTQHILDYYRTAAS